MITSSIKDILEMKYGNKIDYSEEELNSIDSLTIDKFDVVGDINEVDFKELLMFPNLKNLTINRCMVDSNVIQVLLKLDLESLYLYNCEIIDNMDSLFIDKNIPNFVLDNTNLDLLLLEKNNYDYLVISNIKIDKPLAITAKELDITKAFIDDFSLLNGSKIDKLVLLEKQYSRLEGSLDYCQTIIIKEDNGQFVKDTVINNG